MGRPRCQIILKLVLIYKLSAMMTCGEMVKKCCPKGEAMAAGGNCVKREVDVPWLETFPPPTFSASTDEFVSVQLRAAEVLNEESETECKEGETKRELMLVAGAEADEWLLLVGTGANKAELYITGEPETLLDFCLEEIQDGGNNVIGTVAQFCSVAAEEKGNEHGHGEEEEEMDCSSVICVSVCCPPGTLVKRDSNECENIPAISNYMFEPPFVDKKQNPVAIEDQNNYKIVHREPQCEATLSYEGPTNRFVVY